MSEKSEHQVPEHFRPGSRFPIGSHTFEADEIIRFASQWDPQPFHVDPDKAGKSLFGGLCASGWHTASIWMKLQRQKIADEAVEMEKQGRAPPLVGPSPGMRKLRWMKPVFAGDTVTYFNEIRELRPSASMPGWHIMTSGVLAENQHGEPVMSFESAVFLKLDQSLG